MTYRIFSVHVQKTVVFFFNFWTLLLPLTSLWCFPRKFWRLEKTQSLYHDHLLTEKQGTASGCICRRSQFVNRLVSNDRYNEHQYANILHDWIKVKSGNRDEITISVAGHILSIDDASLYLLLLVTWFGLSQTFATCQSLEVDLRPGLCSHWTSLHFLVTNFLYLAWFQEMAY